MKILTLLLACSLVGSVEAQQLRSASLEGERIRSITTREGQTITVDRPLVIFLVTQRDQAVAASRLRVQIIAEASESGVLTYRVEFTNPSTDTLSVSNVVPLAPTANDVYITGLGKHPLSRTHLFQPKRQPVNVIVPDNAWELGFTSVTLSTGQSLYGFSRRDLTTLQHGQRKRFETMLYPSGSVAYRVRLEISSGDWHAGLRQAFQHHMLFDKPAFDSAMYQRPDLQWIRKAYVIHLLMTWDKQYYDAAQHRVTLPEFMARGKKLYGGDDVIGLWPTWPTLGLDQRNQFDLYNDLPGGLTQLRAVADTLRKSGTRFFVAYNPWDESTREEQHMTGLEKLIRATSADGVVLDTKGESSRELQAAADRVKPGVIMYSEGMAVPRDMEGIVAGRVHNALYYPPMLNLNKLIRPDFAIFRVAEVYKEPILREYATSFFNGYGTEINQFAAGHPEQEEEQYRFLGKTTMILRANSSAFTSRDYTPLVPTLVDSIWVNQWSTNEKKIYTVFSLLPAGFVGSLFPVAPQGNRHLVDLWNHELVEPQKNSTSAPVVIDGFSARFAGTNNEGAVGCIGELPQLLRVTRHGADIAYQISVDATLKVWSGNPSYEKTPLTFHAREGHINLLRDLHIAEGKVVVQAFHDDELLDETILHIPSGEPLLISERETTALADVAPTGMVTIPAGRFTYHSTHGDDFIRYPSDQEGVTVEMPTYFMDKFPVTNAMFKTFIDATHYRPADTANFLRHWPKGHIPKGQENFPVVYVSYEDAKAFAKWADKRLPTEMEWQYAAQTDTHQEWPWKQTRQVTRREEKVTETLTVFKVEGIDAGRCNLGDGKPYAVGRYPRGANRYGLEDLTGCVWQLTQDVYESGSYRYVMMKGGSYFKPGASWWYVQGGPRELTYKQYLLRVSPGFERNATVGFRCVKDSRK